MALDWNPNDLQIIDIGGKHLSYNFDYELPRAFAGKDDFPKEFAFAKAMEKWHDVTNISYQTVEETAFIEATAQSVVADMPSAIIIDIGAANSTKFEPYVRELLAQKKKCIYVALDLCRDSLDAQIKNAKAKFPSIRCVGLWGNFHQGSDYWRRIPGHRLFLSHGSLFFNDKEAVCQRRCEDMAKCLSGFDRLVVGQDSPWSSAADKQKMQDIYDSQEYRAFIDRYLERLGRYVGIRTGGWSVDGKFTSNCHIFEVTATRTMACDNFNDKLTVGTGTVYTMFPSWKRREADIHAMTTAAGLSIRTIGRRPGFTMMQYLIQPRSR